MQNLEEMKLERLRAGIRILCPETRGFGGFAHKSSKEEIIAYLAERSYTAESIENALNNCAAQKQDAESFKLENNPQEEKLPAVETTGEKSIPNMTAASELAAALQKVISSTVPASAPIDENKVRAIAESVCAEHETKTTIVEVRNIETNETKNIGKTHYLTPKIIKICACGANLMLTGAAGSGKTTAGDQTAQALGLEFFPMSLGPQTTKSDLLGFIDAGGNYHASPVRKAFENGGLLLLDEMDAANAGVLTIVNSLLANGYCSFPDKTVQRHEKFRCICACNTFGRGADAQYIGRNRLDAATLDRFVVLEFPYDENLELEMSSNQYFTRYVQHVRANAERIQARVVISPRASKEGGKLLKAGFTLDEVKDMCVFKGISSEIRSKIDEI